MKAFRGPKVWLWRWRRNPLKRRTDVAEAWLVLGTWLLTVLTGVLAGLAAVRSAEQGLARERATWRPAVAQVVEPVPGGSPAHSRISAGERVWVKVRWTAADGSAHTGRARVAPGSKAGTLVTVWTDEAGRLGSRPASASEGALRAALLGGLAGVSCAAVPLAGGLALRGRLERRRMDAWAAEWAWLGPRWGRRV
ncbi:hypothetical protein LK07_30895 [Streptomyces pluripotens]|uniref:Proline rich protein membrane protein n=1 Tax=Streptomyces pluripotens TaxID=1355015 RepID=A0A221P6D6_9ACTN|nr:hypothetical protein LK06_029700 [Streptomyces pluripotens]ASN27712.1 hypothetical protein LK07_30895 [Streptomyces pluripotens]